MLASPFCEAFPAPPAQPSSSSAASQLLSVSWAACHLPTQLPVSGGLRPHFRSHSLKKKKPRTKLYAHVCACDILRELSQETSTEEGGSSIRMGKDMAPNRSLWDWGHKLYCSLSCLETGSRTFIPSSRGSWPCMKASQLWASWLPLPKGNSLDTFPGAFSQASTEAGGTSVPTNSKRDSRDPTGAPASSAPERTHLAETCMDYDWGAESGSVDYSRPRTRWW